MLLDPSSVEINPDRPNIFFAARSRPNQGNTKLEAILGPLADETIEKRINFHFNYIHFEITGDPWNLIGPKWCDLFPNCTIFCSKSHPFFSPSKWKRSNTNRILLLTMVLCDFKMDVIKW